jgi:hypothetical protein
MHLSSPLKSDIVCTVLSFLGMINVGDAHRDDGCYGKPNSSRLSLKIIPSLQFRKRAPKLASAADATTKRKIAHRVKMLHSI